MFQEDSYITYLAVSSQDRLGHWFGPRGIVGNYRSPYGKPLSSFSFFSIIVNPSFRDEFDHFSFAEGRGGSTISRGHPWEGTHTHTRPLRAKKSVHLYHAFHLTGALFAQGAFYNSDSHSARASFSFLCILIPPCFFPHVPLHVYIDTVLSDSSVGKIVLFSFAFVLVKRFSRGFYFSL